MDRSRSGSYQWKDTVLMSCCLKTKGVRGSMSVSKRASSGKLPQIIEKNKNEIEEHIM